MRTRHVAFLVIAAGTVAVIAYRDHETRKEALRAEASAAFRACDDLEVSKGLLDRLTALDTADAEATVRNIAHETPAMRDYRKAQTALVKDTLVQRDYRENAAAWECRQLVRVTYGGKPL